MADKVMGVDLGTMFFQVAERLADGSIVTKATRNAFVELEATQDVEDVLSNNKWQYVRDGSNYYVIGEDAMKVANILPGKVELRRPLQDGVLNKGEEKKLLILQQLVKNGLGEPSKDGKNIACFCVSSPSADGSVDSANHKARLMGLFKSLGWMPVVIDEGYAVILSENPTVTENDVEIPLSGIGISFGAGRVNCVLTYKGMQLLGMSVARCLSKDFPVITKDRGILPIEKIVLGDMVLNANGEWCEVLDVINNGNRKVLREILLDRLPSHPLRMTDDHRLWVKRGHNWQWAEAADVKEGETVGIPVIKVSKTSPAAVYLGMDSGRRIRPNKSRDLGRLFGLFLGDGSTKFDDRGHGYVQLAVDERDEATVEKYDAILCNLLDIESEIVRCGDGVARLRAHRTYLARYCKDRFYDENGEKKLPIDLSDLTDQMALGVIEGLLDSDGCRITSRRNGFTIYNTSTHIVQAVHHILNRFGIQHSISRRDPRLGGINKRGIQIEGKKDCWEVYVPALSAELFDTFCRWEGHGFFMQKPDYAEYRVARNVEVSYDDNVYDLRVSSDHHSFSSLGCVAHNCGDWIDQKVQESTDKPLSVITRIKETKLDFNTVDFDDDVVFALDVYYGEMIKSVFSKFAAKFKELEKDSITAPLPVVIAGGTSMPKGFCKKVEEVVSELSLPFEIKEVRHATEPRDAVVKGCLLQALRVKKKLDKEDVLSSVAE